jgi:signal transduction histidine kinase/CheY-like chemotaxis protein
MALAFPAVELLVALAPCVAGPRPVVAAQERRAAELEAEIARAQPGSERWFALGFEWVEAQLDVDVRAARARAEELYAVAERDGPRGTAASAAAFVAFATALAEGSVAAAEWSERAALSPPPEAPLWRAHHALALSRTYCVAGLKARELEAALDGEKAALASGDAVLAARAALILHHVSPASSPGEGRATLDVAAARVAAAQADFLRPWLLADEHLFLKEEGRTEAAARVLDELAALAEAQGHRRALGFVELRRGRVHHHAREDAEAIGCYRRARATMERLGDRSEIAYLLEVEADSEIRRGELARAAELVASDLALIQGRGLPGCERGLLQTRFDLAVQQHDGELAAELARELERADDAREAEDRGAQELYERHARVEAERRLAEAALAARARRMRVVVLAVVAAALAAIVGVALVGRRRLLAANRRLQAEVVRANEAQEARARLERRLGELERAESLGMLASGIAHDFNNLLTCMLGNAELLGARARDERERELLKSIQSAGESAAGLCRKLRSYAGHAPFDPRPVELAELVRGVLPVLGAAAEGLELVDGTPPGLAVVALADRAQLEQALLNLVTNAREAGARRVTVRALRQRLEPVDVEHLGIHGALRAGSHALLEVLDDGAGMSPEILGRIFDPFFTTRFPGRGLGLAAAHGIARRHGGGIHAESAPGRGARFRLFLPEAPPARGSAQRSDVEAHVELEPGECGPLVVLDDEPGVRDLLVHVLASAGYTPVAVASGAAALAALTELPSEPPPLLLLDLTLPGQDGAEVLRRVRAEHPQVTIVLMSGQGSHRLDELARVLGPEAVLAKPFERGELLDALARAMRARGALHPVRAGAP